MRRARQRKLKARAWVEPIDAATVAACASTSEVRIRKEWNGKTYGRVRKLYALACFVILDRADARSEARAESLAALRLRELWRDGAGLEFVGYADGVEDH